MVDEFSIRLVRWETHSAGLTAVRYRVFVEEQGVPEEIEVDENDRDFIHAIAVDRFGTSIGTGRISPDGQIGRIAVLPEWRGRDVGTGLMGFLISYAESAGMESVHLHGQVQSMVFYEKLGFVPHGPEFLEAGIAHREMTLALPNKKRPR